MSDDQIYLARQPIFDRFKRVFAYELLFRSGTMNRAQFVDGNTATSSVITNSFIHLGIDQVTDGRPAFINFTRDLLVNESATLLPVDLTVVEILENIQPEPALVEAVERLRVKGYRLALDDFVALDGYEPLLKLADIIKIDFLGTSSGDRKQLVHSLGLCGDGRLVLLAEKVEDNQQFQEALELGCNYFQGYFFSKPVIITGRVIPALKMSYLRILQEIHNPTLDFNRLEQVIKSDVSLTAKLLRYINAAAFPWSRRIESVKQALVLLGEAQVRKWVSVVALAEMVRDKPLELAVASCVRGRFCESLGEFVKTGATELDCFLVGSLSTLDAMLDISLEECLKSLPLSPQVHEALLKRQNPLGTLLSLVISYERGEWEHVSRYAAELHASEELLPSAYLEAIQWTGKIFKTTE